MPKNVPTRAAATFSPMASLGPPSAPMVSTTPRTAATMPNPGRASAMVLNAAIGLAASRWCTSRSISIMEVHFQIDLHHGVDFHGVHTAGYRHTQRVAQEMQGVMVLPELLILGEYYSLGRVIDFLLQLRRARFSGKREELI